VIRAFGNGGNECARSGIDRRDVESVDAADVGGLRREHDRAPRCGGWRNGERCGIECPVSNHETIGAFDEIIRTSRTREDFVRQLERLLDLVVNLNRTPQRLQRAAVLAGTATRPELRAEVAKLHTAMIDDYTRSFELAHVREFASFRQPARVIANVISAVILGRVLSAFDNSLPDDDQKQWVDAGMAILRALLNL
jgi:hypothetical protein